MNCFTKLTNHLKEIVLATRLASQSSPDKDKPLTPQEPEK